MRGLPFAERFRKHLSLHYFSFDRIFALADVLYDTDSAYNTPNPRGLSNYLTLISQRAKIEGSVSTLISHATHFKQRVPVLIKLICLQIHRLRLR